MRHADIRPKPSPTEPARSRTSLSSAPRPSTLDSGALRSSPLGSLSAALVSRSMGPRTGRRSPPSSRLLRRLMLSGRIRKRRSRWVYCLHRGWLGNYDSVRSGEAIELCGTRSVKAIESVQGRCNYKIEPACQSDLSYSLATFVAALGYPDSPMGSNSEHGLNN